MAKATKEVSPAPVLTEQQQMVLDFIRENASTDSTAAAAHDINRSTLYRWRQAEPFKSEYAAARKVSIERLIAEAERRAVHGSDRLLEFLLTNYAPDRFSNRQRIDVKVEGELAERILASRKRAVGG